MHILERMVVAGAVALAGILGPHAARAANISATENPTGLSGSQFDITVFTTTGVTDESANGSGSFIANVTANGAALVVLTENGNNSDWLYLNYNGAGGVENVAVQWRSDSDPTGLAPLPTGVVPVFLAETGTSQDVTAALVSSATLSGYLFPTNITVQIQSDAPEAVPEPASLAILGAGLLGLGLVRRGRRPTAT